MAFSTYVGQVALLDDFNRANTGPPPGPSWAAGSATSGTSQLQTVSNQCKRGGAGFGSAVWGSNLGADCLAYVTVITPGDVAIDIRAQQTGAATYDSYELNYTLATTRYDLYRLDNNTPTSLANTTAVTLTANDKIGIMALGTVLTAAYWRGGTWTDLFTYDTVGDGTKLSASGPVVLWANGTTPIFDDLFGGAITAVGSSAGARMMLMGC